MSSIRGTARAASSPRTSSRIPARGIGIIITAAAVRSRSSESTGRPSARRRMSSSSDMPVPKRRVRPQSPPIERAAISSTTGSSAPPARRRSSQCTAPSERPRARAARAATAATAAWVAAGSRDGVT